jgi:zinc protease
VSLIRFFSLARISALVATALFWLLPVAANATKIERMTTPGGIEVWLVRDPTVPLVAVNFGFRGGTTQDPTDKGGTANMMVSLSTKAPATSTARHSMS